MQIIINAGGFGTRLWPLSTKSKPKQFANIIDNESLIQKTFFRLNKHFKSDTIWVTTNCTHKQTVIDQLGPNFESKHILTEPERRDTFAAVIAHAAIVASKTNENETLVYISSDHYFDPTIDLHNFNQTLLKVDQGIQTNQYQIILPATKPYFASTSYGYIKFDTQSELDINPVLEFKEKPNLKTAQQFLKSKEYYWNLGYFAFKYSSLIKILSEYYPELVEVVETIRSKGTIELVDYQKITKTSFDFAILEKVKSLGVIDMKLTTWDDIGNFETVYNYIPVQDDSDYLFQVNGNGNKVKLHTTKKVAFVGVSNLLFIENEYGTLIIDPKNCSEIKQVSSWFDN
jgi:mannose-1-phosphate guanylyltransferase